MVDRRSSWLFVGALGLLSCADETPLVITTVTPPLGPVEGGTTVVIKGENIDHDATVFFGGVPAASVGFVDSTTLHAVTPPGAEGAADVLVAEPQGDEVTVEDGFTYVVDLPAGCLIDFSPAFGAIDVDVATDLTVTYDRDVDVDALASGVTLRRVDTDTVLPVTVEIVAPNQVRIIPEHSLAFFGDYDLSVEAIPAAGDVTCAAAGAVFSTRRPAAEARPLLPAAVHGFAVVGDAGLAVSNGYRGLQVYDLSAPTSPVLVGDFLTEEMPTGIAVDGDRAYVPAGQQGVLIFDIAQPLQPLLLGVAGTPGTAHEVVPFTRDGKRLLAIADGPGGLRIIDVTKPEGPTDVAKLNPSGQLSTNVTGVAMVGDLIAVAQVEQGFALVDTTNPASPLVRSTRQSEVLPETFDLPLVVNDVALEGDVLYLSLGANGFQAFSVAVPEAPSYLDFAYSPQGSCQAYCEDLNMGIVVSDGQLFAASFITGVMRLHLEGGQFVTDATLPVMGRTFGLTVTGSNVYVAGERGLTVFDRAAADGADPLFSEPNGTGTTRATALVGDRLYVAASSRGLETYSLADPLAPVLVDVDAVAGIQRDFGSFNVVAADGRLIVADGREGVAVFDTTNPDDPAPLGVVSSSDWVNAIEVRGDRTFVCNDNAAMIVIDHLSSPPTQKGELFLNDYVSACRDLEAVDDFLYVSGGRALAVLDVQNPDSPAIVSTLELPAEDSINAIELYGNYLFASTVAEDYEGTFGYAQRLLVFDVTDRDAPERVFKSDDLGAAGSLLRVGDKLFVGASFKGIWVFGLGDPLEPELEGLIELPGLGGRGVADLDRGVLYVAQAAGLAVIPTGKLPAPSP